MLLLGIALYLGCPKKPSSKPLVQEAEHAQSKEDDPLLKGFCASDTAVDVVCSKPPSKGGVVPQWALRPRSSLGAADPRARKASLLTNAFVWICEPMQKFYP